MFGSQAEHMFELLDGILEMRGRAVGLYQYIFGLHIFPMEHISPQASLFFPDAKST
jgi:hypothetical protein